MKNPIMKIRLMTPEQRAQEFIKKANAFLDRTHTTLTAETVFYNDFPVFVEEAKKKISQLEEEYNVKVVGQVQINSLLWPEEVEKMQEQIAELKAKENADAEIIDETKKEA